MTTALARELALRIRVNAVAPGNVITDMTGEAGAERTAASPAPHCGMLPTPEISASIPHRIDASEINQIRSATQVFDSWSRIYGGGIAREAVTGQLRWSARLPEAACSDRLHPERYSAVGNERQHQERERGSAREHRSILVLPRSTLSGYLIPHQFPAEVMLSGPRVGPAAGRV